MKKDKLMEMSLGDRMKYYEGLDEHCISPESHIVVRVDGHKFSKFTRGFNKPFGDILSKTLEMVCIDLLDEFNAVTVYHQSDEITLIIPSLKDRREHQSNKTDKKIRKDWTHIHSGRVQKIASLVASFSTMKFNKYLLELATYSWSGVRIDPSSESSKLVSLILNDKVGNAYFDCRVLGVPSDEEALNSVLWRARDCIKNSKSSFSQTYCSHKSLQGKTSNEQIQLCLEKTGKDWNSIDDRYKYGIIVKKESYMKKVEDNHSLSSGVKIGDEVLRSRVIVFSKQLDFSEENVSLMMKKVV